MKNVSAGFQISGGQTPAGSGVPTAATRIVLRHMVFENIGGDGVSIGVQLISNPGLELSHAHVSHITVLRNTEAIGAPVEVVGEGASDIVLRDSVFVTGTPYGGIFRDGGLTGAPALDAFAPGTAWDAFGNLFVHDAVSNEPDGNASPATIAAVGFVDYAGGNYRLAVSSAYHNAATDGTDPGADIDAVETAIAGVV
jgi:hypothetical protein